MTNLWLIVALLAVGFAEPTPDPSVEPTTNADTSDLVEEGQDQVAILKQINRHNEDGSYTFGYEAADGSFKIETRDVAGNVKGMFGFVDEGGELRRVSYSASNGTGFQSTGAPNVPPLVNPEDMAETTTRINLISTSTTEKPLLPVYIYGGSSTTTAKPTHPEVIQHIPRVRPTPATIRTEPTESGEVTTTRRLSIVSLLPRKSPTPNYISLRKSDTDEEEENENNTRRPSVIQLIRPRVYKKVVVTKRPVESTTTATPTVSTTFFPVRLNGEEETESSYQREVDGNSITEAGLAASGTEDSPDVYGGSPTARPFPVGIYRNVFPQIPQYQRILQSYPNPNLGIGPDPRVQPAQGGGQINPFNNPGVGAQGDNPTLGNRYPDPALQGASGQGVPYGPTQAEAPFYGSLPFPQNIPQGFRPGNRPPQGYFPQPPPQDILQQQVPQGVYQQQPPGPFSQIPPPILPPNITPRPRPNPQTLPTPSYNPEQGLAPTPKIDESTKSPPVPPYPPQPQPYNTPYPYNNEQSNPQMFLMEQLLRMLINSQYQQPPTPQLSPFQQALLSILGPNNVPPEFIARNYDPRYQSFQQRPQYDPRYQLPYGNPYGGYQDPYAAYRQPYNQYNGYYQNNPYQGYSPNPYYQGSPEEALLRMFLGAPRYPSPPPPPPNQGPIPQIQQSPAAFDRSQPPVPRQRQPIDPDIPVPSSPAYGRRIPVPGNVVERSPVYSRATTPSTRSKGSRNVQIIEEGTTPQASSTTTKPR